MDLITTVFLMKLIASGLVFAVLFLILAVVIEIATNESEYDRYSDFLFVLSGWSVLFSALCTVLLILIQIWGT